MIVFCVIEAASSASNVSTREPSLTRLAAGASPKPRDLEHGMHTIIVIFMDGKREIRAQRGGAAGS